MSPARYSQVSSSSHSPDDQYEVGRHERASYPFVRLEEAIRRRKLGRDDDEVIRDEEEGRPDEEGPPHCAETVTGARGKSRADARGVAVQRRVRGVNAFI